MNPELSRRLAAAVQGAPLELRFKVTDLDMDKINVWEDLPVEIRAELALLAAERSTHTRR